MRNQRLEGIDLARALAIFGMVAVNFRLAMGAEIGSRFLLTLMTSLEGRAASLFVLLAGVGISLMLGRSTAVSAAQRLALVRRGLLLFALGLAYTPIWPADILHFYGVYFLVAALLVGLQNRPLLACSGLFVVAFPLLMLVFSYDKGWNWETLEYENFWTLDGMIRHLLFNGFHPVIPWCAFLLFGVWLGRQPLSNAAFRRKASYSSLGLLVAVESLFLALRLALLPRLQGTEAEDLQALLSVSIIPPLPQYLLSAGASATLILMLCIGLAETKKGSAPLGWLIKTGKLSLTLYVAHVLIGMGTLEAVGWLQGQAVEQAALASLLFCLAAIVFSTMWLTRFRSGPLEALFRKVSG